MGGSRAKGIGPHSIIMAWWLEHETPPKLRVSDPQMQTAAEKLLAKYSYEQIAFMIKWVAAAKRSQYANPYKYTPRVGTLLDLAGDGPKKGAVSDRVVDSILRVKNEIKDNQKQRPAIG